jgi:uncharacterized protein YbjT (DUF2867 family)
MVTVLGERGMLGSVVARRWVERGDTDHVVNCIRPDDLNLISKLSQTGRLIQPSTDAIAEDSEYARTKRAAEAVAIGAVVIRAGIVDIRQHYPVVYRNWMCNPLTPLEWADFAWEHRDEPGLHVTGRETVTRYDVAKLVAEIWDRPKPVAAMAEAPSGRVQSAGDFPPLADALREFHAWL